MHANHYLAREIFPAIEKMNGHTIIENADICFYRTLEGNGVMLSDCTAGGSARGIHELDQIDLVEALVDLPCQRDLGALELPVERFGRNASRASG